VGVRTKQFGAVLVYPVDFTKLNFAPPVLHPQRLLTALDHLSLIDRISGTKIIRKYQVDLVQITDLLSCSGGSTLSI